MALLCREALVMPDDDPVTLPPPCPTLPDDMAPDVRLAMAIAMGRTAAKYGDLPLLTAARRELVRLGKIDPLQLEFSFPHRHDDDRSS